MHKVFFETLESRQMLSGDVVGAVANLAASAGGQRLAVYAPKITAQAPARAQAAPRVRKTSTGPLVITHGGTYSGVFQSLNANVPAIDVRTSEPVIIQNSTISSRGTLIQVYGNNANITVRNNKAYGLNPNVNGRYPGRFLDVEGFRNIVVQNNYMENTSGIYLYDFNGGGTVKVLYNKCQNVDGRVSNGKGGWRYGPPNPDYYRQFFQINGVHNIVGAEVAWNQILNLPGQSRVEENINIHNSWGTPASPFRIHDNYIQGAYPANAGDAQSYTGGGIMTSDNGSSYIHVYNNQIVATGHIGITITSGHDNIFYNNRIVSDGRLPSGKTDFASNTGAVIWNFNNEKTFKNNRATGNLIGWVTRGQRNDWWVPNSAGFKGNKSWGKITAKTEAGEFTLWQNKTATAGLLIGSNW